MPSTEILQAVDRASRRAAATAYEDMRRRLNHLATIAVLAPFAGFLGTAAGIANSFVGLGGSKGAILGAVSECLSQAMLPTALGLLFGLTSLVFYRYLTHILERVDLEMNSARLDLLNTLSRIRLGA